AASCTLAANTGHTLSMPMTPESYRVFWDDVSTAVPDEFGLIHYNTPRVHNYQRGPDYAVLQAEIPNLVGTKHVSSDVSEFMTLMACAGDLSHFTGEHAMTSLMMLGARGVYSWFVNFNARYMVDWHADAAAGRWDAARHRQERMHAFIQAAECLRGSGNLHAIVGKAVTAASSFLVPANRTRRPYLPVPDETVRAFRC